MSDAKHETIADIVTAMRGPYYKMGRSNASLDKDMMGYMSFMANRIEAAAKREVAELRECLKETMVIAIAEYHHHSCFKHVKCGEIERCKTCKVVRWRKALQDEGGAK